MKEHIIITSQHLSINTRKQQDRRWNAEKPSATLDP